MNTEIMFWHDSGYGIEMARIYWKARANGQTAAVAWWAMKAAWRQGAKSRMDKQIANWNFQ